MVVDNQCVMPSVAELCDCYHTILFSTSEIGRFPNAVHLPITNRKDAQKNAKEIIKQAIRNKESQNFKYKCKFDYYLHRFEIA